MIYCLSGKIVKKTLDSVVLSCGGVGYWAQCPASVAAGLPGAGSEATLYTVLNVTENDISLYGFATEEQQNCFRLLTGVSGVGPKVGLAILSVMEPQRVYLAVSAGDHKAFKAASGVGPKLAQRIVRMFAFRIPYYVGPLQQGGPHSWVVRSGETPRKVVLNSVQQLKRTDTPLLGVVLNRANVDSKSSLYYHRYYKSGYYYKNYGSHSQTKK